MIAALLDPDAYDHPVERVECLETHISWVLLTGAFAYKIKKPLDLGFVDFSTPERRHWFCQEELRLNRRLAPSLYLGLCSVHGPRERATFRGSGPSIETAVRMRQFPQEALLPAVLDRGGLDDEQIERLADDLAAFHGNAAIAGAEDSFGDAESIRAPAVANLEVLAAGKRDEREIGLLRQWTEQEFRRLQPTFAQRRQQGRIRECHGDLHLGNMLLEGDHIQVFDCLEFSPSLRWIDVISDMAFLVMDLDHRERGDLGAVLLNRWLARTGDYAGLLTWRWYRVYRSLVRAKVCALRRRQQDPAAGTSATQDTDRRRYLEGACRSTAETPAALVITHGVSGSGKSHRSRQLCRRQGWIHLRSDVERLRLFGRWGQSDGAPLSGDPYRPEVSEGLYRHHLPLLAGRVLEAGLSVVVDATFLLHGQRLRMEELAREHAARFLILDCPISAERAEGRIARRRLVGQDPSEADEGVLADQLRSVEPLAAEEREHSLTVASARSAEELIALVDEWLSRT